MRLKPSKDRKRRGERGHLMAGVMVLVAIMGVMSAVAVQDYAEVLRRDNEAEMMFRAQEIVRAIQRYRRDHGGQSPTEIELLMEPGTRGQYYLRRLYDDPLVKDGKWGLLLVGPGNTIIDPNAEQVDPLTGAVSGASSGLPGSQGGPGGLQGTAGGAGRGGNNQGSSKQGSTFRPSTLRNSLGNAQQTGLPIAGVRTLSDESPYRVYNGLTEYNEWLFTYFDLENAQIPGQRNLRPPGRGGGRGGIGGVGNRPGAGGGAFGNRPGSSGSSFGNGRRGGAGSSSNPRNNRPGSSGNRPGSTNPPRR